MALLEPTEHVRVDWGSLSLAAQAVEAFLDPEYAESAKAGLERLGLRVDRIIDRQITC